MGLDDEPSDIEEILESLEGDLEGADEMIGMDENASFPLINLETFEASAGYEADMMGQIAAHYGVNFAYPQVVKTYTMQGTPGTPGEGEITVRVFATKVPDVFLGEYTHANGQKDYTIRAQDIEE